MDDEHRLIQERRRKLEELRERGVDPYPHLYEPTHKAQEIKDIHSKLKPGERSGDHVSVAGRLMLFRSMGKIAFGQLQDQTGQVQLFFKQDLLEDFDLLRLVDLGDWLGTRGEVIATKTGEITIEVQEFTVLCKALRPPPEKYHGVQDFELRYRKRYLDLLTNEKSRNVFLSRAKIVSAMRRYLDEKGFIEVETPTLQPVYGGAAARPFVTHHNALDLDLYLRISDELYLKRLLVGGFERVYEICKDFRNEGVDTSHNPEFTMLEWYMAFGDYETGMRMFEEIVALAAREATGGTKIPYQGVELDLTPPWPRKRMIDLIKEHGEVDVLEKDLAQLQAICKEQGIEYSSRDSWGVLVQHLFEHFCEEHLVQPVFVIDHPIETTPLCKQLRSGDGRFVERFEPFIAGMEVGNAYTELNDPVLQRKLLEDQHELKMTGDEEAHPMDEDFLEAIEQGMPPTSGVGIGVDRIVMLLTDSPSIRDVILFPTMRPEK